MVKNPSVNAGAARDRGSTAGPERCLGEGNSNGNPLQDSCLENPMDRGVWQAYSPWGCKDAEITRQLGTCARTHTDLLSQITRIALEAACWEMALEVLSTAARDSG